MPILDDIMDNEVIGRERRIGMKQGQLSLLIRWAQKRFGPLPGWAEQNLSNRSLPELEVLVDRILDAASLEDFLR